MKESRLRVLYVEDSTDLRPLVVSAFDAIRFRVMVAAGLHAAKFLASRERFDAVVCGRATTARAVWEFICGRPTRIFVLGNDASASLPPRAISLPAPSAHDLADAVGRRG